MQRHETFGETLTRMMRNKDCTVKVLTQKMGFKSANTISRLMTDKSGKKKIEEFCEELCRQNPLRLIEHEKKQLRDAAEVSIVGIDTYTANQQMLHLVQERPAHPACICTQSFGANCLFVATLDDLIASYSEYRSIDVMLQGCAFGGVTRALKIMLENADNHTIHIAQYVNASGSRAKEIQDFLSLLDIMGHPHYEFYFSPAQSKEFQEVCNVYSNVMVVLKCDKNGNKWTDIIAFLSPDSFRLLYNLPGEASYQFNFCQFEDLREQHIPAKAVLQNDYNLKGMLDYNSRLLEMDLKYSLNSIRPDISLCMVPPDIAKKTALLLCKNEKGIESDTFSQYLEVVTRRYQLFTTPGKRQCYFFSRTGIYQFLKCGKSKANVFGLRDLTVLERRQVIEGILQVAKEVPTTTFHLLNNELHYNGHAYLLYGEGTLLVDNYPSFRNYDPAKGYHSCWIHSPHIAENFSYFLESELIRRYACSEEETLAFLEQLLQETF